jgi:hypothetical protein
LDCLTEQRAASERGQCGRTNDDKRQIRLHENDTSDRSLSAQSNSSNLVRMGDGPRITRRRSPRRPPARQVRMTQMSSAVADCTHDSMSGPSR